MGKKVILQRSPQWDDVIIYPDRNNVIPTKQDDYKLLNIIFYHEEGGEYKKFEEKLYQRSLKPASEIFQNKIKDLLKANKKAEWPHEGDLEIYVNVTARKSRIDIVDVDNLLKNVMDALKGVVYKDDKQIQGALCIKTIVPNGDIFDGLLVGVRKVKGETASIFEDIKLIYPQEVEVQETEDGKKEEDKEMKEINVL